ncbi:HAD-like domain-protein [Dipodascopsis uninucleata]
MTITKQIRACLFDMDGLLISSEEIYTKVINGLLKENGRPPMPWEVKADLQGRPGTAAAQKLLEWAQLDYTPEEFYKITTARQTDLWCETRPMPGSVELLDRLVEKNIPFAMATSSQTGTYILKTKHLTDVMFSKFPEEHIVKGDDSRIPPGRGKPCPDIWQIALKTINDKRKANGLDEIEPHEVLVFEDGIPGVEGARAAGCNVIWVPDPNVLNVFRDKVDDILGPNGELLNSLSELDYESYGL